MSESSTKNMSNGVKMELIRERAITSYRQKSDEKLMQQLIRKLKRIKQSSGDNAVLRWMANNAPGGSIVIGNGSRSLKRISLDRAALFAAINISV